MVYDYKPSQGRTTKLAQPGGDNTEKNNPNNNNNAGQSEAN